MERDESRIMRYAVPALVALSVAGIAYLLLVARQADPDMFWHAATGRWIAQHRAVPTVDPFSWWAAPRHQPWVAMEWLFGLAAFGLWSIGGWTALYAFTALMLGTLLLLSRQLMLARGVPASRALLLAIVVAAGTLVWTTPRPQTVSFVLVTLAVLLLEKGRWPLALITVLLGVNVHGGMWPVYVLLFAYYELPRRWWLVGLAFAVTLVNPNTMGVLLYPVRLYGSRVTADILEWGPTQLWSSKGDLLAFLALGLAVRGRRIPWRDGLFALAFVVLSLSAVRHLAWFYVLVVPVLAPHIALDLRDAAWIPARWRDRGPAPVPERTRRLLDAALVGVLGLAVVALGAKASVTRPDVSRGYPTPAIIAFLERSGAARLFNAWGDGGYLIWHGVAPLIDGRFDPYLPARPGEENLAAEYVDAVHLRTDPHSLMAKLEVDFVMLPASRVRVALRHDPAFTPVMADGDREVFRFDPAQ